MRCTEVGALRLVETGDGVEEEGEPDFDLLGGGDLTCRDDAEFIVMPGGEGPPTERITVDLEAIARGVRRGAAPAETPGLWNELRTATRM